MHNIEPHFNWQNYYIACQDPLSPFFNREYNEFNYTHSIYNYVIHPQWDNFGSDTLVTKILFVDYTEKYAIIEMLGEWNDTIENDIMIFKRDLIDELAQHGIDKYIIIGENVLNFHTSDDSYYEEWFEDVADGYIAFINFRQHVLQDFETAGIDSYINMGGNLNDLSWRTFSPIQLCYLINKLVTQRIN